MTTRKTWPIAVRREASIAFVGIADRLGDGRVFIASPEWPALEQVAGDDWSSALLTCVLPSDHVWGWWTRAESVGNAKLGAAKASDVVELGTLAFPAVRSGIFSRMAFAIIPPRAGEQEKIKYWAGSDTEHIADILVTSPASGRWSVGDVVRWCSDGSLIREPQAMRGRGFERIVVIQDGFTYVALAPEDAEALASSLDELARRWGIETITGDAIDPWPFTSVGAAGS